MDLWPPLFRVSWSHTYRHTVGLLWMSDQPVAEASNYTGQHNRQTSMPRAGFEPATPATKRPQTYRAATGIGQFNFQTIQNCVCLTWEGVSAISKRVTVDGVTNCSTGQAMKQSNISHYFISPHSGSVLVHLADLKPQTDRHRGSIGRAEKQPGQ
jgi:hypothetical protein